MISKFIRKDHLDRDGTFSFEKKLHVKTKEGAICIKGSVVVKVRFTVRNKRLVSGSYSKIVSKAA